MSGCVWRIVALQAIWLGGAGCALPEPVRVMSFNIRYGTADDGVNRWSARRPLVIELIREYEPDILGLQEVEHFQAVQICDALPEYEFVGAGRDDGDRRGEFAPILYRRAIFQGVRGGHFWLSQSPGVPGSVGWDAALPRIATWVRLRFNSQPMAKIHVINTHLDHRGERARVESARLLRNTAESLGGTPLIVMGDFNCEPGSPPYQILTEARGNLSELRDAYAAVGDAAAGGTYHAFTGRSMRGRIDWILHSRRFEPLHTGILQTPARDGVYPSDHYPVTATLRLAPVTRWDWM